LTGKVYLVGAGPGAPDLITLRAARLIERADIMFHDALVHQDTVALARGAEKIAVGKRCGKRSAAQRFINKRLVDAARKHDVVVRLKGGDPMLFGRAQEEIAALKAAGIAYEIVPGVTAALAASAEIGVSLTRRGEARSVTFATPRVGTEEEESDWAPAVLGADTSVLYMGVGQAAAIARCLLDRGMSPTTPVRVVENASLPEMREFHLTLAELHRAAEQRTTGPAVIMLGNVFGLPFYDAAEAVPNPHLPASVSRLA
jgi:uroporphyrin-III C-methyltransferase